MELTYANNKGCKVYENLMNNPSDRVALKSFTKTFSSEIVRPSFKLDQRLKSAANAKVFNQNYPGDNAINLLAGVKDNAPLIFKVRIQDAYRKFFNFFDKTIEENIGENVREEIINGESIDNEDIEKEEDFCLTKLWTGQFERVEKIYIYDINKHEYKK